MNQPTSQDATVQSVDLEIKDAQVIFKNVWEALIDEVGYENLRFPKEFILLGGAPGAGKGTHTRFIMKARGLTCKPIVVSDLLTTSEAQKIKDSGQLVGDTEVIGLIFLELLKQQYRDGALLDGFPRTRVQVECLKMLVDRIHKLNSEYAGTINAMHFRRSIIHAMVLFVSKKISVERQLNRGEEIEEQNRKVAETGVGELQEIRGTDSDPEYAAKRYRMFKEKTWDALRSLKEIYHYHFINAEGPIREVEENITRELQYQSSLELEQGTFDRLNPLPIAQDITLHARQELVRRLDCYELQHQDLFIKVVQIISEKFMPIVKRHALSGQASVRTEDPVFDQPIALAMLIDIFSERGYNATVDKRIQDVPERFDLNTGEISCREKVIYRVVLNFEGSAIRRR